MVLQGAGRVERVLAGQRLGLALREVHGRVPELVFRYIGDRGAAKRQRGGAVRARRSAGYVRVHIIGHARNNM